MIWCIHNKSSTGNDYSKYRSRASSIAVSLMPKEVRKLDKDDEVECCFTKSAKASSITACGPDRRDTKEFSILERIEKGSEIP